MKKNKIISSTDNTLIKIIQKLINNSSYQNKLSLFVCETYKIYQTLILNKFELAYLLISDESKITNKIKDRNFILIKKNIYKKLSCLENGDGLIAVFKMKNKPIELSNQKKYLILNNLQDVGNVGTILRTSAWFGIDAVFFVNNSVNIYSSKLIRSSMGYNLTIPTQKINNLTNLVDELKRKKIPIIGTVLGNKSKKLSELKKMRSFALMLGNEGNGISNADGSFCDLLVKIPSINTKVDSLNVSVSCGIILYHLTN